MHINIKHILILLFLFAVSTKIAFAAPNFDLTNTANWTYRIDGDSSDAAISDTTTIPLFVDLNGNGIDDIIVSSPASDNNSRSNSGSVYIIYDSLINTRSLHESLDLSSASNYNIRFDGITDNSALGVSQFFTNSTRSPAVTAVDLNGNGVKDLIINSHIGNTSLPYGGSVYVIFDSIYAAYQGTGNNLDLTNTAHFSARLDGGTGEYLGSGGTYLGDIDGNSILDLGVGAAIADYNSRTNSGSVYIVRDLISQITSAGMVIDLTNSSNYWARIDGAFVNSVIKINPDYQNNLVNFDNNDKDDLIIHTVNCNYNGSYSGCVYIIKDSLLNALPTTGNILDLATTSSFSFRIDGSQANASAGNSYINFNDISGDGRVDLIVGEASNRSRLYIISGEFLAGYSGTGNILSLANSSHYNLLIEGGSGEYFGIAANVSDFNKDGHKDLLATAPFADYNSRSNSGSVYLFYNSLIRNNLATPANTLLLSDQTSYNVRFDGGTTEERLGIDKVEGFEYDNDGYFDLFLSAKRADYNGRTDSGSGYIIPSRYFRNIIGSGNVIDLLSESNYLSRFDGQASDDLLSTHVFGVVSLSSANANDVLIGSHAADNNSKSNSGSLYIIYNFPHTITLDTVQKDKITGTISAPNSSTNIAGVQYNYNNNDPASIGWTNCIGTTSFTCTLSNFPSGLSNRVYIRAYDVNLSYTNKYRYQTAVFADSIPKALNSVDPNCKEGFALCINAGPNFIGAPAWIETVGAGTFSSNTVSHDDLRITVEHASLDNLSYVQKNILTAGKSDVPYFAKASIPFPWSQDFDVVSNIYAVKAAAAFNGYPITKADNPFTIKISYDQTKLRGRSPKNIKVAYYDASDNRWRILPAPTIVDLANHTIFTTTKTFSLYALVYPQQQATSYEKNQVINDQEDSEAVIMKESSSAPVQSVGTTPTTTPDTSKREKRCFFWGWICLNTNLKLNLMQNFE